MSGTKKIIIILAILFIIVEWAYIINGILRKDNPSNNETSVPQTLQERRAELVKNWTTGQELQELRQIEAQLEEERIQREIEQAKKQEKSQAIAEWFKTYGIKILIIITGLCIFGGVCQAIVTSKGYNREENYGFVWGFFLGLLGLIVCCAKPAKIIQPRIIKESVQIEKEIQTQLDEIIYLKQQGYITEDEFNQKRKQILEL